MDNNEAITIHLSAINPSLRCTSLHPPFGPFWIDIARGVAPCFHVRFSGTPSLPLAPYNYADIDLPPHFGDPKILGADNTPDANPVTDRGATLGRVLFYDTRLSIDESKSCASCHLRQHGFADTSAVSTGVFGRTGTRNSMSLVNTRFYKPGMFLWDHAGRRLKSKRFPNNTRL